MVLYLYRVVIAIGILLASVNAFAKFNKTISAPFHNIMLSGNISTVNLHYTRGASYMIVHGHELDIEKNEFYVADDWLKANVGEGYPKFGNISLDIWVNDLLTLHVISPIIISGKYIHSSGLVIYTKSSPQINLSGKIALQHVRIGSKTNLEITGVNTKRLDLKMRDYSCAKLQGNIGICGLEIRGHSRLSMYWVNTYKLKFTLADYANVQLGGQVKILDLDMYNNAKFGGQYLRVHRLFLKTNDLSEAQISAVRSQFTYAIDNSKIDYFNEPLIKNDFMSLNGETLFLGD
jgi:hypothetical protein